jgi:hypothetical protein
VIGPSFTPTSRCSVRSGQRESHTEARKEQRDNESVVSHTADVEAGSSGGGPVRLQLGPSSWRRPLADLPSALQTAFRPFSEGGDGQPSNRPLREPVRILMAVRRCQRTDLRHLRHDLAVVGRCAPSAGAALQQRRSYPRIDGDIDAVRTPRLY